MSTTAPDQAVHIEDQAVHVDDQDIPSHQSIMNEMHMPSTLTSTATKERVQQVQGDQDVSVQRLHQVLGHVEPNSSISSPGAPSVSMDIQGAFTLAPSTRAETDAPLVDEVVSSSGRNFTFIYEMDAIRQLYHVVNEAEIPPPAYHTSGDAGVAESRPFSFVFIQEQPWVETPLAAYPNSHLSMAQASIPILQVFIPFTLCTHSSNKSSRNNCNPPLTPLDSNNSTNPPPANLFSLSDLPATGRLLVNHHFLGYPRMMRSGKSRFCVIGRDGECNGEDELTTGSGHTSRSGDTLEEEEAQRSDTDDMNDDFEREYTFDEVTGTFVRRAKDVKGGDVLSSPPSAKRKRSSSMGDYSSPAASPVSASASSTLEEMDVILDAKIQITYRLFHNFVVGTAETYYPYLFAQEKEESTRAPSNQDVEAEVQKSTQTDGRDLTGTGNQIGVEPGRDRFKSTAPSPSLCSSPVALAAHTDAKSPNPSHTSSPSATLETELPYFYPKSIRIMWIPGQDPVGTVDPVDVGATDITNCGDAYLGHVLRVMKRRGWVDQLVILWAEDK